MSRTTHFWKRTTTVTTVSILALFGFMLPNTATAASVPEEGAIIVGGTVQHDDPSSYDFVPRPDDERYPHIRERSAWGQEWIGGVDIGNVSIPKMVLTHDIKGEGLRIDKEEAYAMSTSGRICNYRIDFQNRHGERIYQTVTGETYWGCHPVGTSVGGGNPHVPYNIHQGAQCARLFINGDFVGEQCHSIHP